MPTLAHASNLGDYGFAVAKLHMVKGVALEHGRDVKVNFVLWRLGKWNIIH